MKFFLFSFLFLQTCLLAYGQEQGNFRLSAATSRASFTNKTYTLNGLPYPVAGRTLQSYGVALEYYVGDYVSLAYSLEFGNTSLGARYMRYPFGIQAAAVPFISALNFGGDWIYAALLLAITPESVVFHFPVQENKFYIAPYISPLGIYREKLPNQDPTPSVGFAIGSKVDIFSGRFAISPYLGTRTLYRARSGSWGIEGGIHVGLLIND